MLYLKKNMTLYLLIWLNVCSAMFTPPQMPQWGVQKPHSQRKFISKNAEELAQTKIEAETKAIKALRSKKCYDVMILMDDIKGEKVDDKDNAVGNELVEAFAEKSFPLIVSTNLVYNMCINRPEIEVNDDIWYCYDHPQADVMFFIPKKYLLNFSIDSIETNADAHIRLSGFNTAYLKKIAPASSADVLNYLKERRSVSNRVSITDAIESLFVMPTQPNSPTWNIYLIGHGKTNESIAGLHKQDFFTLLQCFQKINTSLLHYCSCFSGGSNLMQVREQLAQLNVTFIVSAQGINEEPTYSISTIRANKTEGYQEFFKRADAFFGDPYAFVQTKKEEDPIAFVLSPIINKLTLDYSQPFIYIPATGIFNALGVDKEVKIITKAIAQAHTFEDKTIDCTNPSIKTIIMYPHYLSVPVKIGSHIAIVSPTQEQTADIDLHFFEEMIYGDTLSSVIFNCVSFNLKYRPTIFVIKKLHCFNYLNSGLEPINSGLIALENVIIYCGDIRSDGRNRIFNVFACFDFNQNSYKAELLRNKISKEGTANDLFKRFETISYVSINETSTYPNPIDNLPYTLIDYQPLVDLLRIKGKRTYIALAEIVDALQEYNRPHFGEEPGSLKKVLLKKQLENVAQEAHGLPAKLHRAKERLSQRENNYHKSFITYLQRLKEKIKWLEQIINTMPVSDPSKNQALNDIKTILDKELAIAFAADQSEKEEQSWADSFANTIQDFYSMFADYTEPIRKQIHGITSFIYDDSKKISKPR